MMLILVAMSLCHVHFGVLMRPITLSGVVCLPNHPATPCPGLFGLKCCQQPRPASFNPSSLESQRQTHWLVQVGRGRFLVHCSFFPSPCLLAATITRVIISNHSIPLRICFFLHLKTLFLSSRRLKIPSLNQARSWRIQITPNLKACSGTAEGPRGVAQSCAFAGVQRRAWLHDGVQLRAGGDPKACALSPEEKGGWQQKCQLKNQRLRLGSVPIQSGI